MHHTHQKDLYFYGMDFKLQSEFKPTGDQPEAIRQLTDGINSKEKLPIIPQIQMRFLERIKL